MIAVIGAGPAGLLAAWHAARAGHEVTVLERAERVGGLAGSFEVAGQRVDLGSHRLHPSTDPALLDELRGLLGADLQTRPRHGRIAMAGRLLRFPLRTADLVRGLPPRLAGRMALDAATAPLRRPRGDTYADVVRAGLGPAVYDSFYGPYARKLWGVDGEALAGEVARRRIAASSPVAIVRRLLRATDPAKRTFLYPRRGFGQLSEALADVATAAGATIRLGADVTALRPGAGGVRVEATGGGLDVRQVWSSVPIPVLPGLVDGAPEPVVAAAARLEHRAMVLLYLVLEQPRWTDYDAHYLPDAAVVATRLSEPKRYRSSAEDPAERTVLCVEIPCALGDAVWTAEPGALAERFTAEVEPLRLPAIRVAAAEVRRVARLYPIYRAGHETDLTAVEAWVASLPGVVTFGRQGLFVADNTHHVMAMGRALAASLQRDGSLDADRWAAARASFRTFVVED